MWSYIYDVHNEWAILWPPYPLHLQKWTIDLLFEKNRIHTHRYVKHHVKLIYFNFRMRIEN